MRGQYALEHLIDGASAVIDNLLGLHAAFLQSRNGNLAITATKSRRRQSHIAKVLQHDG